MYENKAIDKSAFVQLHIQYGIKKNVVKGESYGILYDILSLIRLAFIAAKYRSGDRTYDVDS